MRNEDGALAFDVLIRDNDLNQMLAKDEQRIAQFTQNVEGNSQSIVNSFGTIGKAVGGIAIGAMMKNWITDVVNVRGEFQQLEIAFTTMLGSAEKATSLMAQVTDTAATTPFDLKGVANGAKQLLAYGESADTVNDTLVRLGNIASGLSLPLNDLVYLYGTTMVQGRLFTQDVRQFMGRGIPLVQELAKQLGKTTEEVNQMVTDGKIGFPEVQKVLERLTDSGGMFYNLMEEQSKSLTGQISNLGDAWDMMLNEIGQSNEGILSSGIGLAGTLVENYQTVLNVLEGLIVAYGTYKVALAAVAIQQKKSTGIATLDNIVAKARMGMYTSLTANIQAYVTQTGLMSKAQQAYTIELQKSLSLEQQENLLRGLKVTALQGILTAEQQVYLSRLNINAQSVEYIAAAEGILTTDQRLALQKKDLGRTSIAYSVAVENEIKANQSLQVSEISKMRAEATALKQKQALLLTEYRASQNKIEQTRIQISLAKLNGDSMAVENLQQQQYNQLKAHAVIVTDLKNAKVAQEAITTKINTAVTQQATLAGKAKVAGDVMQTTSSSMLSTATTFLTVKLKALWATMMANPLTAILSIVGLVISAFMMFRKEEEQDIDVAREFEAETQKQMASIKTFKAILDNTTEGTVTHKKALEKLNGVLQNYSLEVIKEGDNVEVVTKRYNELTKAIKENTAQRLLAQGIEKINTTQTKDEEKALEKFKEKIAGLRNMEWVDDGRNGGMGSTKAVVPKWVESLGKEQYELIQSLVKESISGLSGLTGEAYEMQLAEINKRVLNAMAAATQASEKEVSRSSEFIDAFVNAMAKCWQRGRDETDKLTASVTSAYNAFNGKKAVEEIDYTTMSLEQLHKKAEEMNGQIVVLKAKGEGFEELEKKLNMINSIIGNKQGELNTESGINEEIKRLKALKEKSVIGGTDWNNYDSKIKELQKKLPDTSKEGDKKARAAQEAAQKEIDVQMELEESRIALIKDGYKRRVAEAELQHKKELARIDKEEKELEAKYKDAGKKMPTKSKEKFATMRSNENAGYEVTRSEMLDVQIEEQKKKYQLYYKWVATYGEDVANEQYAELIQGGKTYTDWLKSQIDALEAKKGTDTGLTETESNQLITLKTDYNEVTGVKTEMDKFTESLAKAKEQSKSLSEYMGKLAQMKLDLQQGNTGLIGEDRTDATNQVNKEMAENTEELQRQLLETYKTNAQLRLDVEKQYDDEIYWLKQNGFTKQAELAEKAKIKAVAEVDATRIQTTDSWKNLFENAQYLGSSAFDKIVAGLRKQVEALGDVDIKNDLLKQLEQLEQQTQGMNNPFKQLVKSIKEYKAAGDDVSKQKSMSKMFNSIAGSIDIVSQSFDAVVDGLKKMGAAGDEETQAVLNDVGGLIEGAGQLAAGYASMNPVQMIQGGIGMVTSAISLFDSTSRRIKREMAEHEKQLKSLQDAYNQISFEVDNAVGEDYYKKQKEAIANLQEQIYENEELARLEKSKKDKDRDDNKVREYEEAAKQAQRDIEDIQREITESLVQTNFKDLANDLAEAWADAFSNMEDSAENFDEVWNKTVANAVKNSLKLKIIEPIINDFTNALASYMGENDNSVVGFNFDYWKKMLKNAGDSFTQGLEGFEDYFQDIADEIDDSSLEGQVKGVTEETASVLAGEITTMRIKQAQHLLVCQDIRANAISIQNTLKEAVSHLSVIATNTGYNKNLVEIKNYLKEMSQKLNVDDLRAKGYM